MEPLFKKGEKMMICSSWFTLCLKTDSVKKQEG
jgi:hypothetical protein